MERSAPFRICVDCFPGETRFPLFDSAATVADLGSLALFWVISGRQE